MSLQGIHRLEAYATSDAGGIRTRNREGRAPTRSVGRIRRCTCSRTASIKNLSTVVVRVGLEPTNTEVGHRRTRWSHQPLCQLAHRTIREVARQGIEPCLTVSKTVVRIHHTRKPCIFISHL